MSDTITPLFILGLQRSGTTWMANSLGGHPSIVAIEAEEHQGVHESIFFSHFAQAYGDLADDSNFNNFAADFTACDYFLLCELDPADFIAARPRTYFEAFSWVMDRVAQRQNATYWLEKSPHHTLLGDQLAEAYPTARFVCVTRDAVGLLRSRMLGFGRSKPSWLARMPVLLRGCLAISLYNKYCREFCRRQPRALLARYEDMIADQQRVMTTITAFLGLPFDPILLERRYRPNTSFTTETDRESALNLLDKIMIRTVMTLLGIIPRSVLQSISQGRAERRGIDWPNWCWRRNPDHVRHIS